MVMCCARALTAGGTARWQRLGPEAAGNAGGLGAAEPRAEGASGPAAEGAAGPRARGRRWGSSRGADVASGFAQLYIWLWLWLSAFFFDDTRKTILDVILVTWRVWIVASFFLRRLKHDKVPR